MNRDYTKKTEERGKRIREVGQRISDVGKAESQLVSQGSSAISTDAGDAKIKELEQYVTQILEESCGYRNEAAELRAELAGWVNADWGRVRHVDEETEMPSEHGKNRLISGDSAKCDALPIPAPEGLPQSQSSAWLTMPLTDKDAEALGELSRLQELSPERVMIQGLRIYQTVVKGGAKVVPAIELLKLSPLYQGEESVAMPVHPAPNVTIAEGREGGK